jgi:hypothetical protein
MGINLGGRGGSALGHGFRGIRGSISKRRAEERPHDHGGGGGANLRGGARI